MNNPWLKVFMNNPIKRTCVKNLQHPNNSKILSCQMQFFTTDFFLKPKPFCDLRDRPLKVSKLLKFESDKKYFMGMPALDDF